MSKATTMESQQSSLSDDFNFIAKGFKWAAFGFVAAVGWQVFLDPIFFPIFHDTTNATAQAFVSFINSSFDWIPDIVGLTGDGGLLNMDWAQNILEPHYDLISGAQAEDYMGEDIFGDDSSYVDPNNW